MLLAPQHLAARDFGTPINIAACTDLFDYERGGDLSLDELDLLLLHCVEPLDLNTVTADGLYNLPDVGYGVATGIIRHRDAIGRFESRRGLLEVAGVDAALYEQIAPFLTVSPVPPDLTATDQIKEAIGRIRSAPNRRTSVATATSFRVGTKSGKDKGRQGPQSYLRAHGFLADRSLRLRYGAVLTRRERTKTQWDYSRGATVSSGPSAAIDLDHLFISVRRPRVKAIVGSYVAGFAEGLVFDLSTRRNPSGVYEHAAATLDLQSNRARASEVLFGAAATVELPIGPKMKLKTTLFSSLSDRDVFVDDYRVGLDDYYLADICDDDLACNPNQSVAAQCFTDGDCPFGYTCGDNLTCTSGRVYDRDDPEQTHQDVTLMDATRETLAGANATLILSQNTTVGITGYAAEIEMLAGAPANPVFSLTSRYPQLPGFGAIGLSGSFRDGFVEIRGELARSLPEAGDAAFLRARYFPSPVVEMAIGLRYYDRNYDNPFGRGEAAADETLGSRQRNEQGARLTVAWRPWPRLRLQTVADVWQEPFAPSFSPENGELFWEDDGTVDLRFSQRATLSLANRETISLTVDYANDDLQRNDRAQTYGHGGSGEKRSVALRLSSWRFRLLRFEGRYRWRWQDASSGSQDDVVNQYATSFYLDQRLSVRVRSAIPRVVEFTLGLMRAFSGDARPGSVPIQTVDRRYYLEISRKLSDLFSISGRYGVDHHPSGSDDSDYSFHVGRILLQGRWK